MHNEPCEKLRELIVEYGRSLCDDPRRCEALLKDYCGQYKREIFVLITALRNRVAEDLLKTSAGVPHVLLLARLIKRLEDELAMTAEAAQWAVESWTLALRVVSADIEAREILKIKGIDCTVDVFLEKAKEGNTEVVKWLIAAGIDINSADNNSNTALGWALYKGHTETVQALLAHGAKINDGKTAAFMRASLNGYAKIVQVLLTHGAKIEARDGSGLTALMWASYKGHTETVQVLLAHGADIEAKDYDGWTALISASMNGHTETVLALLAHGASGSRRPDL